MAFWAKNKQKDDKNTPTNIRIDVEDMTEQNYTCKEIAEELGITEEQVYRIKNAKRRRESKFHAPEATGENEELKRLQIEIKKQELEQKKLQIQWDAEDRKTERIIKLKTLLGEYSDEDINLEDRGDGVIERAITALASAWFAQQQANNGTGAGVAPQQSAPVPIPTIEAPRDKIDKAIDAIPDDLYELIKTGKTSKEQVMAYATAKLGFSSDEAEEGYKRIMEAD